MLKRYSWIISLALVIVLLGTGLTVYLSCRQSYDSMEAQAIQYCKAYCEAQVMYHRNDWDADGNMEYAYPHAELDRAPEGAVGFVSTAFSEDEKFGYQFLDMQSINGKAIDWKEDFALCATPRTYGETGRRTFIVKTDGLIWGKDLGKSEFVKDFPKDPTHAGWELVEEGR